MATTSLGQLTLDLVAKIAGFEQGMDKAARTADKRMKEIERRATEMGKALGGALATAAGIAATGIGIYIKNTIEAEKVQAQLAARIRDTVGVAGRSIEQLNAQADKLQSITIFDDESVSEAQAMLLTFKQVQGVNFDRTIESALDLATVMGTDAADAAKVLGKALSDPEKGLTQLARAGITFTETERERIKTMVEAGQVAEAQAAILDKLSGSMGSAAEAARDTLGGALQSLKNTFDNLLEGDSGGAGMKGMVSAVNDLNDSLSDPEIKEGIDSLAEGLLRAGGAAVKAASMVGGFIKQYEDWLASKGFARADQDTSLEDLQTRLEKLQKQSGKAMTRWLAEDDIAAEIERTKKLIDGFVFRGVSVRVDSTAFDRTPTADLSDGSTATRRAAKATKELTEAEKQYQDVMQVNAYIDEMVSGFRMDQVRADYEKLKVQDDLIDQAKQIRDDIEFETQLLGLSIDQQEQLTLARQLGATAATEQGKAALEALEIQQQMRQMVDDQIYIMDSARDSTRGFFQDLKEGEGIVNSLESAFGRFADAIFDWASSGVTDMLLGKQGTTQGSGWLGSLLSGLFGGGAPQQGTYDAIWNAFGGGSFANGGYPRPWTMNRVNERGPELLTVGGQDFLMMGSQGGKVTPNHMLAAGASNVNQTNHFHLNAPTSPNTQTQIAAKVGYQTRRNSRFVGPI